MQIRHLKIVNFRGIRSFEWSPVANLCCLIGAGDARKSTVLEAIEATLSPRWITFMESDFLGCDTAAPICIEATVGELSKALLTDERFGLHIRGWSSDGALHDEPDDQDEPVLTVRLSVDATMEPAWELVRDAAPVRGLSNRDRVLFGLVRLSGDDPRHLTWAQGSVLAKLTGEADDAARNLADAYRSARDSAQLSKVEVLVAAASAAQQQASILGAYIHDSYAPGLELLRGGFSTSSIALHDGRVPLRLAGLGTRRLATLAIQRSAISEGAIVLVDEIEHGLEPHRVIGAIARLQEAQATAAKALKPVGQVLMTTHSDIAIGEMEPSNLSVCIVQDQDLHLATPASHPTFRRLLKHRPRALFARRLLVCEGVTEVGLLLGLREQFQSRHGNVPIEQRGVALVDGEGTKAPALALSLAALGYPVAIYRDSDRPLGPDELRDIVASQISVFEYNGSIDTESALISAANDRQVQELIDLARSAKGRDAVSAHLEHCMTSLTSQISDRDFAEWGTLLGVNGADLRKTVSATASNRNWFKELRTGRAMAPIAWEIIEGAPTSPVASCVAALESWLYE